MRYGAHLARLRKRALRRVGKVDNGARRVELGDKLAPFVW